jgi:hypothetical protein
MITRTVSAGLRQNSPSVAVPNRPVTPLTRTLMLILILILGRLLVRYGWRRRYGHSPIGFKEARVENNVLPLKSIQV